MDNIKLEEITNFLSELISFNTLKKDTSTEHPLGKNITKIFDFIEKKANKDKIGKITRFKNYALEIEIGEGSKVFTIPVHLDIVPFEKNDWETDPLKLSFKNGYYYGRGTTDNKGPGAILYQIFKDLKSENKKIKQRVKLVFLGDEETEWKGTEYYLSNVDRKPDSGFVPDADFPLINGEKGIHQGSYVGTLIETMDLNFDINVFKLSAGNVINAVPGKMKIDLELIGPNKNKIIRDSLEGLKYTKKNNIYSIVIEGIPSHGSKPDKGRNAFDKFICIFDKYKFNRSFQIFLEFYKKYFFQDNYGKKIGFDSFDDEMGPTTLNKGIIEYNRTDFKITYDIRRTRTLESEELELKLDSILNDNNFKRKDIRIDKMIFESPNSELVKMLLSSYIKITNDKNARPFSIGGGTYARAFPNTLAFGPNLINDSEIKSSNIHGNNENISKKAIEINYKIYKDVIINLS